MTTRTYKKPLLCLLAALMILSAGCALFAAADEPYTPPVIAVSENTQALPEHINFYDIDARLNADNTLSCLQKTTYINNTGGALESLFFHAYPNAYQNEDETFFTPDEMNKAYPNGFSAGGMDIASVTGEGVTGYALSQDGQLIEIALDNPLQPESGVDLTFQYTVIIPNCCHRFGYNNGIYNIANFYPIACAYDASGWAKDNYCGTGDPFYSDTANYQVAVTLPKGVALASTGDEKELISGDGTEKHLIDAPLVRDFAFCFSKNFKIAQSETDNIKVLSFYTGRNGQKAAEIAADAIKIFNRLFGKYEYPVFSVVDTNFFIGGMEYPNLVMLDHWMYDALSTDSLEYVVAHETAHQWWYSIVGNDEVREAWLDEGLTEYSTMLYFKEKYGEAAYNRLYKEQVLGLYEALGGAYENDPPMNKPITEFSDTGEYQMLVYDKPAVMYHDLRLEMGDKKFFEGLQTYFFNNKYCVATHRNLIAAFEQATNLPWSGKIKKWIKGGEDRL